MLPLLAYAVRKHAKFARNWGKMTGWMYVHQYFGILGPLLIVAHSAFTFLSFNAIVAFFTMVVLVISGFIGRWIQVNIEKRGYKELFKHWHVLHIPLVFIFVTTVIVHIIAVHMY